MERRSFLWSLPLVGALMKRWRPEPELLAPMRVQGHIHVASNMDVWGRSSIEDLIPLQRAENERRAALMDRRLLGTLALLLALAIPGYAQVVDSAIDRVPSLGGSGGGGSGVTECSGDQDAFGVCLDTATGEVVWEGATADGFEARLSFTDPTVDAQLIFNTNSLTAARTLTVPDVTGTLALLEAPNDFVPPITSASRLDGITITGSASGSINNSQTALQVSAGSSGTGASPSALIAVRGLSLVTAGNGGGVHLGVSGEASISNAVKTVGVYGGSTSVNMDGAGQVGVMGSAGANFGASTYVAGVQGIGYKAASVNRFGGIFYLDESNYGAYEVKAATGTAALAADNDTSTGDILSLRDNGSEVLRVPDGGQLQLVDAGTQPTCDATTRGSLWYEAGGAGVADSIEVCAKDSSDVYAWTALASIS